MSAYRPMRHLMKALSTTARVCLVTPTPDEMSSRYDGPGVRIVLFLSGAVRGTHRHNPDTWHLKMVLMLWSNG